MLNLLSINVLLDNILRKRLKDLPQITAFFIKNLRIFILALKRFKHNKCYFLASALTFYFLLSVIPLVALAFGIAKGFGYERILQKRLIEEFPGHEQVTSYIIKYANSMLETVQSEAIAGIGAVFLIWSAVKLLENIENSFNEIWEIKAKRTFGRKFSDYLSIMLIAPIMMTISSGLNIFVNNSLNHIITINFLPYLLIWILFTLGYIILPNTNVNFLSGILGGILAGSMYQFIQWIYINFQIGVANYNAIYGSFSAFPLFLIWVQTGWIVILFGAEISYAHQNIYNFYIDFDSNKISPFLRTIFSIEIARLIVKRFKDGTEPLFALDISKLLDIPVNFVNSILIDLKESGVISAMQNEFSKDLFYQPAIDINKISIFYVIDSLDKFGEKILTYNTSEEIKNIEKILNLLKDTIINSPDNKLLKDIV